jgi:ribosomal subunit interface protein
MQLQIRATGLELSEATKVYVTEKVSRAEKYLAPHQSESAVADVHLVYKQSNTKDTKDQCHITISGVGKGQRFHAEAAEPDMHVAIDHSYHKVEEQLRREKDKRRDRMTREAADAKRRPPEQLMDT